MITETTTAAEIDQVIAPDFEAETVDGDRLRLAELLHHQHVILVFNRGFT
jgi:hypothetical protein